MPEGEMTATTELKVLSPARRRQLHNPNAISVDTWKGLLPEEQEKYIYRPLTNDYHKRPLPLEGDDGLGE